MVPGQRDGEYRKEQLAVAKQLRARPALLGLRSAAGLENKIADAIAMMVTAVRNIDEDDIVRDVCKSVAARAVRIARINPAAMVMFTSPTE